MLNLSTKKNFRGQEKRKHAFLAVRFLRNKFAGHVSFPKLMLCSLCEGIKVKFELLLFRDEFVLRALSEREDHSFWIISNDFLYFPSGRVYSWNKFRCVTIASVTLRIVRKVRMLQCTSKPIWNSVLFKTTFQGFQHSQNPNLRTLSTHPVSQTKSIFSFRAQKMQASKSKRLSAGCECYIQVFSNFKGWVIKTRMETTQEKYPDVSLNPWTISYKKVSDIVAFNS